MVSQTEGENHPYSLTLLAAWLASVCPVRWINIRHTYMFQCPINLLLSHPPKLNHLETEGLLLQVLPAGFFCSLCLLRVPASEMRKDKERKWLNDREERGREDGSLERAGRSQRVCMRMHIYGWLISKASWNEVAFVKRVAGFCCLCGSSCHHHLLTSPVPISLISNEGVARLSDPVWWSLTELCVHENNWLH